MMIIFAFKKAELKEKTQDANFSLPIKNPNPLLKNGFQIRIANPNINIANVIKVHWDIHINVTFVPNRFLIEKNIFSAYPILCRSWIPKTISAT